MTDPADVRAWLERCVAYHGHYCMGQALGVRIGLKGLDLARPRGPKDLLVVAENDRCIADALQIVTGTRLGRRSFKLRDYGKMAATFLNTATGRAWRVHVRHVDPRQASSAEKKEAALLAPEEELLAWEEVSVSFPPHEMPGKPRRTVDCARCGEKVFDGKDLPHPDGPLCASCAAGEAYYETARAAAPAGEETCG